MSFRRFLYVVADDLVDRSYSLRRIDMSRFFYRPSMEAALDSSSVAADPSATGDAGHLPDPVLCVSTPQSTLKCSGSTIDFLLFKNKGHDGENLKVVTMDHMGRTLMCDPSLPPAVLPLPPVVSAKFNPFSFTVGGSLYVMDVYPEPPNGGRRHSFQVLSHGHHRSRLYKEWYWHPLPPPPYVNGLRVASHYIDSCAVVGGTHILVSNRGARTYCFDTLKGAWTKAGDWPLPFGSLAEYVPEHRLWFGLSSVGGGSRFVAANLMPNSASDSGEMMMMSPPVVHGCWKEYLQPPPEWILQQSCAVHLGSSKFCIARFFVIGKSLICPETGRTYNTEEDYQVVLTGVEVKSCGEELQLVKHKSEHYKLSVDGKYWVI